MIKLLKVLTFSVLLSFSVASRMKGREEDSNEEIYLNRNKRMRRGFEAYDEDGSDGNDFGVQTVTGMLRTTGFNSEPVDPAMRIIDSNIIKMTERQLETFIDESFFKLDFNTLKHLHKRGLLDDSVTEDHLISLCRTYNTKAHEILEYLINNNVPSVAVVCRESLANLLIICISRSFRTFKLLWERFDGYLLSKSSLGDILYQAANGYFHESYDLVMDSQKLSSNFPQLMKNVFNQASLNFRSQSALNFLMFKNIAFKDYLNIPTRINILAIAAKICNRELTEYILREEDIKEDLMKSTKTPWLLAIHSDCFEVLQVYMQEFAIVNPFIAAKHALKLDKPNVIAFLLGKGILDQEMLTKIALFALDTGDIGLISQCIRCGFDVENVLVEGDVSLFNYAIMRNNVDFVKLFIEDCKIDVNKVHEKRDPKDSTLMIFTCLYYARSREMVQLLSKRGADLDFVNMIFNANGGVVTAATKMHLAAQAVQVGVYETLRELGANTKIEDERGATAEEIFDGLDDLYS